MKLRDEILKLLYTRPQGQERLIPIQQKLNLSRGTTERTLDAMMREHLVVPISANAGEYYKLTLRGTSAARALVEPAEDEED